MSEPKITPLARRLAEENGIDWRTLKGSGPEGTIVERDILSFLAKVMAGEIDLPPAPEEKSAPPEAIPDISQAQAMLAKEGVSQSRTYPGRVDLSRVRLTPWIGSLRICGPARGSGDTGDVRSPPARLPGGIVSQR
ncbi:MAG: E3 binding domain-containing protein [Meiothermus silvanus]|nr:E3 binding domain-containing protein [Allomeiothermus silvanus]